MPDPEHAFTQHLLGVRGMDADALRATLLRARELRDDPVGVLLRDVRPDADAHHAVWAGAKCLVRLRRALKPGRYLQAALSKPLGHLAAALSLDCEGHRGESLGAVADAVNSHVGVRLECLRHAFDVTPRLVQQPFRLGPQLFTQFAELQPLAPPVE